MVTGTPAKPPSYAVLDVCYIFITTTTSSVGNVVVFAVIKDSPPALWTIPLGQHNLLQLALLILGQAGCHGKILHKTGVLRLLAGNAGGIVQQVKGQDRVRIGQGLL